MFLAACGTVPRERLLTVTPGAPRSAAAHITSYQDAVDTIVSVMAEDLQIPVPETSFTLYFYSNREAFAQGLTEKFNTDPVVAREIATSALGRIRQTQEGKYFLVNEEILEHLRWPDRIHVLAHELTHIVQYELAGGRLAGDLWLVEGFADWVACRVLEVLGLDTFGRRKNQKMAQFSREQTPPSLSQMATVQDWDALSTRHGGAIAYGRAFLATDHLIQQHGLASVIEYFRHVNRASSRRQHFRAIFGEEPSAFERDFNAYLERLLG
ncbi:MAG TPA: hypothetical protein VLK82_02995 [Candidatus Tectomicrobia bacterium]|nr:hypothetical protein [Candidatus Tectomicrobia bacterium]